MANIKGYESTDPANTNPAEEHTTDPYREPGHMAKGVRARWLRPVPPEAYPWGTNDEGGT